MRRQLLFIFSIVVFGWVSAQQPEMKPGMKPKPPAKGVAAPKMKEAIHPADTSKQDSVAASVKPPKEPAQPFSMSFLLDYGKPALSMLTDETRYEGGINLMFFDHYSIIAEYGHGELHPKNALQNGNYYSEGDYFRVGGGYMNNVGLTSKLGLSVRYAQSTFTDRGEVFIKSASGIQDGYETTFGPRNSEARWVEVVITSESRLIFDKENPAAKINHLLSLGFHARLRFLSSYDRYPTYDTYAIPGYGRTVNNPNPAINLFLRITPF